MANILLFGVPGGNLAHLSPEVLNSFYSQINEKEHFEICYSKQPSFEFGVLCFEII